MAEENQTDESQKTEEPTPRKLEEARKKGQIVLSREINNWVIIFAGAIIVLVFGPWVLSNIARILSTFLSQGHNLLADGVGIRNVIAAVLLDIGFYLLVPVIILLLAAFFAPFAQVGPLFSVETIKPKPSKISPLAGIQRLFSGRALMDFAKGILKLCIITIAVYFAMLPFLRSLDRYVGYDATSILLVLHSLTFRIVLVVLSILFVVAVFDYIYQRHEHMKKMRMSKQEIKDEFKQTEGDPHIKAKLRQLRTERARGRMMAAVPEADVIITNPTHYAVALKYDPDKMAAPVMVAKGLDAVAERIKALGREHDITIIENPPLARALHASMDIDDTIPSEHFKAVAEIISFVFRKKRKPLH